ncbi:MAG: hypothetical protein ACE361_23665 [Aureliella sp.]
MLPSSEIRVSAKHLASTLTFLSVLIVIVGGIAHISRHQIIGDLDDPIADMLRRLDIVEEPSLSQWFSSTLHLIVAMLCLGIGLSIGRLMKWRWIGLSAIFCFASIDEAIMIHEMMDRPTREWLGTSGFLSIAWIIPGTLIALVIATGYASFLAQHPRNIALLFLLSGIIFLSGAILMEIPGGYLYERYGFSSWHYIASYAIEECLEMLGLTLFLYALLQYIAGETQFGEPLSLQLSSAGKEVSGSL